MPVRDVFKISWRTFINPAGWMDYDTLSAQNRTMWQVLKDLFTPDKPQETETFKQAMDRQGLTETDIKEAEKNYTTYALLFLVLGILVFLYAFYLLFVYGTLAGWLLAIVSSVLFFTQAFKYDFWALQIRRQKLGLSFADWKKHIFGAKGKSA